MYQKIAKKKPLEIAKEYVDQIIAIIADESEQGRNKIITIAKAAEKKYNQPVESWMLGWVYGFSRTRGKEIEQSIDVMKNIPSAFVRLQEFKLLITNGEWNIGSSYNYFLFLELFDVIPDYERLPLHDMSFVLDLKDKIIKEIDSFIVQYKVSQEEKRKRDLERESMSQQRQVLDNVLIMTSPTAAKEEALKHKGNNILFLLNFKNELWHLNWIDETGSMYPLSLSEELIQKLATIKDHNLEKISRVALKSIKRECIKSRDEYLSKLQLLINPEDEHSHVALSNKDLKEKGTTSVFVLRHNVDETSLWWINTMGVPNQIAIANYRKIDSWLSTHKGPFCPDELLQLKVQLLQVDTKQSFNASKLQAMNKMLDKVLHKHDKQKEPEGIKEASSVSYPKLNLEKYKNIEELLKVRSKKAPPEYDSLLLPEFKSVAVKKKEAPKSGPERYSALSELPNFWKKQREINEGVHAVITDTITSDIKPFV